MFRGLWSSTVLAFAVGSIASAGFLPLSESAAHASSTVPAAPVLADATDLILSEYVEGSGTNKAVEMYNGTASDIDLAEYSLELYSNGSATVSRAFSLDGVIAPGGTFVFADGALTDLADQTTGSGLWNGDDAIVLRGPDGVVDSFGQVGVDPGSQWSQGGVSTQNHTLRRLPDVCVGDTSPMDAFDPSAQWEQLEADVFDGLGSHSTTCTSAPPADTVVINELSASTTGPDVEYFEVYGQPDTDYSELTVLAIDGAAGSATVGEVVSSSAVGTTDSEGFWLQDLPVDTLPDGTLSVLLVSGYVDQDVVDSEPDGQLDEGTGLTVVDAVALSSGDVGDLVYTDTVLTPGYDDIDSPPGGASRIPDGTDTDSSADWVRNDVDLAGLEDVEGTPVPGEALNTPGRPNSAVAPVDPVEQCSEPATAIGTIQGSGEVTPLEGDRVVVEGVVIGDFLTGGFDGFYLQDAGDQDSRTSDGIFVYAPDVDPDAIEAGDRLRVAGTASEQFGMTQLVDISVGVCGQDTDLPDPTALTLPLTDADYERVEGMHVTFPAALSILEYFNYGRFGEIALGVDRQFQPTAVFEPGSPEARELLAENEAERITLDDGRSSQNPDPARHPNGADFTLENRFRGGDLVTDATGVLDFRFGVWRLQPTQPATYEVANPRPTVPEVGGSMTVASFNVLNYFTTLGSRGADDLEELERQEAKIVAALAELDADVVGLIEIENNGTAVETLVTALNDEVGEGTYAALSTGRIGTDEITTAFIYQPGRVSLSGDFATLTAADDERFLDSKNRPALAQTFTHLATGESVTVAVNHLKSKGSSCEDVGDPLDPDGQGNCNGVRLDAALALADWSQRDPTGSGESDVLLIGDLNSYDQEDPIEALSQAGFSDLVAAEQGELAYSYVFDGQLGYLDYALANPAAARQVTGAGFWQVNADEPSLLDYDTEFKQDAQDAIYAPDPFRSSDHDAVLVGLDLVAPPVERLAGGNRYATAVEVAERFGDSDLVYVASGQVFPDALAATPVAIRNDAPLVLTRSGALPEQTRDYLSDLEPEEVVVLGGPRRVSSAVLEQISEATGAEVSRVQGANRYATAAALAGDWAAGEAETVYLASGTMFADALSVGPLAGMQDVPVLLTDEQSLSAETAVVLARLDPQRVVVLGGPGRIDEAVLNAAAPYADTVERLYGTDRYATAQLVAERIPPGEQAFLATGEDFPDALGGGVLAGSLSTPLLLSPSAELSDGTSQALQDRDVSTVTLLGGPGALAQAVADQVGTLLVP